MTSIIDAAGVSETSGDPSAPTAALRSVDLRIARGASVAMGASGSGKTALPHRLAGIHTPDAGSILLAGPDGPPSPSDPSGRVARVGAWRTWMPTRRAPSSRASGCRSTTSTPR